MADSTDVLHKKTCANPACGRAFETPIGKQEICGAAPCKRWRQARNMAKYRKPAPAWVLELVDAAEAVLIETDEQREGAAWARLRIAVQVARGKTKASGE